MSKTPSEQLIQSDGLSGGKYPWRETLYAILDSHASQLAAQGEQLARVVAFLQAIAELTEAGLPLTGRTIRDVARAFLTPPAKAEAPASPAPGEQGWPKWTHCPGWSWVSRYASAGAQGEVWFRDDKVPIASDGCQPFVDGLEEETTQAEAIRHIPAIADKYPLPAEASEWGPEVVKVWKQLPGEEHDGCCTLKDDGKIYNKDGDLCIRTAEDHDKNHEWQVVYERRPTPTAKGPGCSSSQSPSSASPSTSSQTGDQTTPTCGSPDAGSLEQSVDAFMRKWLNDNGRFNDIRDTQAFAAAFAAQHAASLEARVKELTTQYVDMSNRRIHWTDRAEAAEGQLKVLRADAADVCNERDSLLARATTAETALAAANERVEAMERVIEAQDKLLAHLGASARAACWPLERNLAAAKSTLAMLGGKQG